MLLLIFYFINLKLHQKRPLNKQKRIIQLFTLYFDAYQIILNNLLICYQTFL